MLEQSPPPPVKRTDRGNARRLAFDYPAQMRENIRRHQFHGIERSARHFQEADLQGEGNAVGRRAALQNDLLLFRGWREKTLNLQR
jgi:hypothetical protein